MSQRKMSPSHENGEKMMAEESERILWQARVLSRAESVYESRERALAWMRRANPRLRGRTPLAVAKTEEGSRLVEELLIQIDEGIYL
jgi:putative toxin-antitoxin system antitoxin component (TIGR02293 family)